MSPLDARCPTHVHGQPDDEETLREYPWEAFALPSGGYWVAEAADPNLARRTWDLECLGLYRTSAEGELAGYAHGSARGLYKDPR